MQIKNLIDITRIKDIAYVHIQTNQGTKHSINQLYIFRAFDIRDIDAIHCGRIVLVR